MVFATLVLSNIFLTLENRSLQFSVLKTIHYPNKLVIVMIAITVLLSGVLIYIEPFSAFFGFVAIAPLALLQITGIALISVFWYELVKWRRRSKP
jgi:Ca2+-transporting ATPase